MSSWKKIRVGEVKRGNKSHCSVKETSEKTEATGVIIGGS